jgi:GMP synthase-like glutamine amidotransferase
MKLLVFQHIACEHPGSLRTFLEQDGITWDAVNLDQGEPIPELKGYDALWVMGGPMDVWDVEEHPWLIPEKAAIRQWVSELRKPYLGLCLGHQLLADALGGTCGPQSPGEIGILDVELTKAGRRDHLFAGTPNVQKCLQWHSVQVAQPPEGAEVLASSDACRVQAMRIGRHAWSMQYHVEIEPDTVANWAEVPAYHLALINSLGDQGYEQMSRDADKYMDAFLTCAERIYRNFISEISPG